MPAKIKTIKNAPKRKTSQKQKSLRENFAMVIRRTFFVLIPVFAFIAGLGILQTSLLRSNSLEELIGNAETSRSFFYSYTPSEKVALFNGENVNIPASLNKTLALTKSTSVLGDSTGEEKWVEVDLSDQKLLAHDGEQIFLESLVSTGLPGRATPTGEFRVWYKIKSTKMEGGEGREHYYLPNVPFVMFFQNDEVLGYKGYSLHGAYWHNDFGRRKSHGCINLPIPVAEKLYYWSAPQVPKGKNLIRATEDNPGIRVVVHE